MSTQLKAPHTVQGDAERLRTLGCASAAAQLSPAELKRFLNERVIGQEQMVEAVVDAVHYARVRKACLDSGIPSDQLPNQQALFVVSSTGTGKSFLFENLARCIDADVTFVDVSSLTGRGWRGLSVDDVLIPMANQQKEHPERLQIVVWDEFDKIGMHARSDSDETFNPAKDLLKILEGGSVSLSVNAAAGQSELLVADMEAVLHVFAGALTGVEEIVSRRLGTNATLGFNSELPSEERIECARLEIAPADLEEWGIPKELVGRIGRVVSMPPLGEDAMRLIAKGGEHSLERKYQRMLGNEGIGFAISDGAALELSRKAVQSGLGARYLASSLAGISAKAIAEAEGSGAQAVNVITLPEGGVSYELVGTETSGKKRKRRSLPAPPVLGSMSEDSAKRSVDILESKVLAQAVDRAVGPGASLDGLEGHDEFRGIASWLMYGPKTWPPYPSEAGTGADLLGCAAAFVAKRYDGNERTLGNALLIIDALSGDAGARFKNLLTEAEQEAKGEGDDALAAWHRETATRLEPLASLEAPRRDRAVANARFALLQCALDEQHANSAREIIDCAREGRMSLASPLRSSAD